MYRQFYTTIEDQDAFKLLVKSYKEFSINQSMVQKILDAEKKQKKIVKLIIEEEQKLYQVCLWLLPACTLVPLHDHPKMHSFIRVLSGSAVLESYSILRDD